jgi:hypothetical protein
MGFNSVWGMAVCPCFFWQCFLLIICNGLIPHPWRSTGDLKKNFILSWNRLENLTRKNWRRKLKIYKCKWNCTQYMKEILLLYITEPAELSVVDTAVYICRREKAIVNVFIILMCCVCDIILILWLSSLVTMAWRVLSLRRQHPDM